MKPDVNTGDLLHMTMIPRPSQQPTNLVRSQLKREVN